MIDVRHNYKPLRLDATPYGQCRLPQQPDAQWEGLSLQSDGRVDDCFRQHPLCKERSDRWIDLVDPRVQNFLGRMVEIKASAEPADHKLPWAQQMERSRELQNRVNEALEQAGLEGSSSSCSDDRGALSTAYISIGGIDTAQHLDLKPTQEGFEIELTSIGYDGSHNIEASTDRQGSILTESIQESAEWQVPWLNESILRNNQPGIIASPNDPRLNQLIWALESGQQLTHLEQGSLRQSQPSVQSWDVDGQNVTIDYARGTLHLHNEGWVDPPAGSDYTGYHGKTDILWQNGQWGYLK